MHAHINANLFGSIIMMNTLMYLLESDPEVPMVLHETEPHELIPDVGDYIEFDDHYDFPAEVRKAHGSLFKVEVRRIGYSVHPEYASASYIRLYVIPASKDETDYIYPGETP